MTAIDPRMIRARVALLRKHPFFGTLALSLKIIEDNRNCETMATDGVHLYYNSNFLDALKIETIKGVVVHEIYHCMLMHMTRRNKRDHALWNVACDFAINPLIKNAGFLLPYPHLADYQFNGMSAEEIYSKLPKNSAFSHKQCLFGEVRDAPGTGTNSGKVAKKLEKKWKQAIIEAKAQADKTGIGIRAGSLPLDIEQLVQLGTDTVIDWREILWRFADTFARKDYSWSKPNKHYLGGGFILPGLQSQSISKVGIVMDTSGSINEELLKNFLGEINSLLDREVVDEVITVQCDTKVQSVDRYTLGDSINLKVKGRGGTKFSPALKWFMDNESDVSALIYFTDLECYDYGPEPSMPVLWAVYGKLASVGKVPFGEVLRIKE